jgi:hypothetical protein
MTVRAFSGAADAAIDARAYVRNALADHCRPEHVDLAVMLVGELVAEAVRTESAGYQVHVDTSGACARVELHDLATGGWGLVHPDDPAFDTAYRLMQTFADSYGISTVSGRPRTAWFELTCD